MKGTNKCPECGNDTYLTKRMKLAWLDVFGASLLSILIFGLLYLVFPSANGGGAGQGKLIAYLLFGAVGLVGWVFTYFVKKETFLDESCTRCNFKNSEKLIVSEESIEK